LLLLLLLLSLRSRLKAKERLVVVVGVGVGVVQKFPPFSKARAHFYFISKTLNSQKKKEEEKNPIHFINSVASFAEYHKFPKRPIASETEWRAIVVYVLVD